ncbi:MAG: sugar transferase [Hydrogenothermaceae bacterium]|nr:sugar transferase [Hydrogenothermaceae bacterium]
MNSFYRSKLKRWIDIFISVLLIIISSPLFILLYLIIRLTLGKPVIFKQERPGLNEKIFTLYKFRTMTDERDENGNLLPDEIRLKGVGKLIRSLSLDELPQLFNVLKGDMSLVGPRPLLVEYLPLYNERQRKRHLVRPGITGLAQVMGRNAISWKEKFEYDVYYVENLSFWLDMKILLLTFLKVIKREGISQKGKATMEKFNGNN